MTRTETGTGTVESRDGTTLAFERAGSGPALILVEPSGHYREFTAFGGLTPLLAQSFTVVNYDRRGRGASGDTPPYAVQREVDDLGALIDAAGGAAFLYGFSSGALLALHAAADGLTVPRMALLEPPIETDEDRSEQAEFTAELARLTAAGRRSDAVEYFNAGIGVPAEMIEEMRGSPAWSAMESVAHTLVYDCVISEATSLALLASVRVPTLVLDSQGSSADLTGWAATVGRHLPNGTHRSLPGEWHGVPDDVLAPVLTEFLLD